MAHLPVTGRCQAAVTISYEAQARLQDPICGCVSHIFALQQQVVNMQAELASFKELQAAAQCIVNNPKESHYFPRDVQSWSQNEVTLPQFDANLNKINRTPYLPNGTMNFSPSMKYENFGFRTKENASVGTMDSLDMQLNFRQRPFQDEEDDLQSMALGYINQCS